ncbi:hypothetical protein BGZ75_005437 [Mortierella antarctica]|nr:hypothetical protein BGZ75_005437 [Mortierella antarctica]
MRTTAAIITFATTVGLLAIQVAADQDIQSTFSNALDVNGHRRILSEYDFLPIFLETDDESDNMYMDSSEVDAPPSQSTSGAAEATPTASSPSSSVPTDYCHNIADRVVNMTDAILILVGNFSNAEASPDLSIVMAGIQGAVEEFGLQVKINPKVIPVGTLLILAKVVEVLIYVGALGVPGPSIRELDSILLKGIAMLEELDDCHDQDRLANNTPSRLERYSAQRCSLIADTYRTVITESIARSPLAPDSAPEDLKNTLEALGLVLHIMKLSFPGNDQLSVPQSYAIPSDWLNQYRTRMAHLANEYDDIREYADSLAPVVSWSNALSACLSASNDPTGAADSMAEHLETTSC